jgi:phenylpyruvate tautomerase PptA (4-oxalocrotonate tautomerase family)
MPLARIDLARGKPAEYRRAIGDVVYAAIIDVLGAPKDDRFIVITEHEGGQLDVSPEYLGIEHSSDVVLIEIALNEGRSVPVKQDFYRTVADGLHDRIGLRREDVIICLVEVKKENWSFGNGIAQYVESG